MKVIPQLINLSVPKNQATIRSGSSVLHFSYSSFKEKGADREGRIEKS